MAVRGKRGLQMQTGCRWVAAGPWCDRGVDAECGKVGCVQKHNGGRRCSLVVLREKTQANRQWLLNAMTYILKHEHLDCKLHRSKGENPKPRANAGSTKFGWIGSAPDSLRHHLVSARSQRGKVVKSWVHGCLGGAERHGAEHWQHAAPAPRSSARRPVTG